MRLLRADTDDLILETVNDENAKYAILSHRWLAEEEEITYADLTKGTSNDVVRSKKGWQKLEWCRQQAVIDGYQYVWADTVCIDKSSSQELTESINSMYRWYEKAGCCYVYLHDMPEKDPTGQTVERAGAISSALEGWNHRAFRSCAWFTRAWTLQEMIAPNTVRFYSESWTFIGELQDLALDIADITSVHLEALTKQLSLASYSIAQKMSWAAGRSATKIEDRAYSLLGIMSVAMPVVYGEGKHAFWRLQIELLRTSSDDSIFAFPTVNEEIVIQGYTATSLLADSPQAFKDCDKIVLGNWMSEENQYQVMSKEINFLSRFLEDVEPSILSRWSKKLLREPGGRKKHQALLQCYNEDTPSKVEVLNLFTLPERPDTYYVDTDPRITLISIYDRRKKMTEYRSFNVVENPKQAARSSHVQNKIIFCECKIREVALKLVEASPSKARLAEDNTLLIPVPSSNFHVELELSSNGIRIGTLDITSSQRYPDSTRSDGWYKVRFGMKRSLYPFGPVIPWEGWIRCPLQPDWALARTHGMFIAASMYQSGHLVGDSGHGLLVIERGGFVSLTRFLAAIVWPLLCNFSIVVAFSLPFILPVLVIAVCLSLPPSKAS